MYVCASVCMGVFMSERESMCLIMCVDACESVYSCVYVCEQDEERLTSDASTGRNMIEVATLLVNSLKVATRMQRERDRERETYQ